MTDWESHYQEGVTPWDKGEPAPALVQFLHETPLTGRILVPGCGLGHDVRALAGMTPAADVVGLDISPSAVRRASEHPSVGNESFLEGDLFQLPVDLVGEFDWVWEHTCFCAIDPSMRDAYVESVKQALKPSGQLLGVFYLNPYDEEHRPEDGRPPFGCPAEALERQFGSVFEILKTWEPSVTYPGREGRELMMLLRARS